MQYKSQIHGVKILRVQYKFLPLHDKNRKKKLLGQQNLVIRKFND